MPRDTQSSTARTRYEPYNTRYEPFAASHRPTTRFTSWYPRSDRSSTTNSSNLSVDTGKTCGRKLQDMSRSLDETLAYLDEIATDNKRVSSRLDTLERSSVTTGAQLSLLENLVVQMFSKQQPSYATSTSPSITDSSGEYSSPPLVDSSDTPLSDWSAGDEGPRSSAYMPPWCEDGE